MEEQMAEQMADDIFKKDLISPNLQQNAGIRALQMEAFVEANPSSFDKL
jgi:hypothetical protein